MRSAMYEEVEIEEGAVSKLQSGMARKWQHLLDVSAPHTGARWGISAVVMVLYALRIYLINGGLDATPKRSPCLRAVRGSLSSRAATWPSFGLRARHRAVPPAQRRE